MIFMKYKPRYILYLTQFLTDFGYILDSKSYDQVCKYACICKYAHIIKYASMHTYTSMQVCKYEVCKYASVQVCKYANMQLCT